MTPVTPADNAFRRLKPRNQRLVFRDSSPPTLRYCLFAVLILSVLLPFVFYAANLQAQKPLKGLNFLSFILAEACKALIGDKVSFLKEKSFSEPDCTEYVTQNHHIACALTAEEAACALAYVVTLHKEFETFLFFRGLFMPQNVYCVHVGHSKSHSPSSRQRCFLSTSLVSWAKGVVGSIFCLWTDLHCTRDLLALAMPWCYLLNTCGQDLSLNNNREVIQLLKGLGGKNITPRVLPPPHITTCTEYVHRDNSSFSFMLWNICVHNAPVHNLTIYFGSAYMAITRPFVRFMLQDQRVLDLLAQPEDTNSCEGHFWVMLSRIQGWKMNRISPPCMLLLEASGRTLLLLMPWTKLLFQNWFTCGITESSSTVASALFAKVSGVPGSMTNTSWGGDLEVVKWIDMKETHGGCHDFGLPVSLDHPASGLTGEMQSGEANWIANCSSSVPATQHIWMS
ncbi:LOW QUALITY PROTEIN: N-acetyllactosaminide beta-1,6-N-acetylglucosaminyl-transferase [Cyanocitta cristata]